MHSSSVPRRIALLAATAALIVPLIRPSAALADDEVNANLGVARISVISGSVAVQRGDAPDPSAAAINAPVLAGDYLTTGDRSRAEVEISGGTAVRLGEGVQLRFTHLDNDARTLQLAQGTIELRLMRGTDGASDVDTPSISIRPRSSGSYRITVTEDGRTLVTVRSGDAEIVAPQGDNSLAPGSTLVAQGPASSPTIGSQEAVALDGFDGFNAERDARFERAEAQSAYVDPNVTGVGDLDAYGRWVSDPAYGEVWTPRVVATDWAPYRDGRWVWEDGFGWTWVATEPWGWAPYHYGSWFHSASYGWAWCPPPPAVVVPVWRPALVAFFSFGGGGSGFGVGYAGEGFGPSVGWVPLAPFEAYHPWYRGGWGGGTRVTINNTYITNTTIVRNYVNAQYGVTSVSGERFTQGDFRHPAVVAPGELRNVQVVRGAVPVVPSSANLRYSNARVAPELAVRPAFAQHAFAGAPAPPARMSFEQQRTAVSNVPHMPMTGALRQTPDSGRLHDAAGSAVARPAGSDAWSRFGDTRAATQTQPATSSATGRSDAHFGQVVPPAARRDGFARVTTPTTSSHGVYGQDPSAAPARGYAPVTNPIRSGYGQYTQPSVPTRGNANGQYTQPLPTRGNGYGQNAPPVPTHGNGYGQYAPPAPARGNGYGQYAPPAPARGGYGQYSAPAVGQAPRVYYTPRADGNPATYGGAYRPARGSAPSTTVRTPVAPPRANDTAAHPLRPAHPKTPDRSGG